MGEYDGTLRLVDAETTHELRTWKAHEGATRALTVAPDGRRIVSAGEDSTLRLWNAAAGELAAEAKADDGTWERVAFSPGGQRVAAAGPGNAVTLYDSSLRVVRTLFNGEHRTTSIRFSPDGTSLLIGNVKKDAWLLDARTGRARYQLTFPSELFVVDWLAFSPDGLIALAVCGGEVMTWDAATGRNLRRQFPNYRGSHRVFFLRNEPYILSLGLGGVRGFSLETGREVMPLLGGGEIRQAAASRGLGRILVNRTGGPPEIWQIGRGPQKHLLESLLARGGGSASTREWSLAEWYQLHGLPGYAVQMWKWAEAAGWSTSSYLRMAKAYWSLGDRKAALERLDRARRAGEAPLGYLALLA